MFSSCCSPASSQPKSNFPRTSSCTRADTQMMPPGSASPSSRTAKFTPSPKMSPLSLIMSDFAVLRLITSSNFVGAWTGRSPGFSPLRMRSTYDAVHIVARDASPDPLVLSWAPGAARSAWVSSHRQCTVATPYFNDWKRFCAVLREIASGENGRPVSGVEAQKRAKSTHSNGVSSNRGLRCRETEFSGQRRRRQNGFEGSRTPLQRQNLAKEPRQFGASLR